jgi:hypothetical protein
MAIIIEQVIGATDAGVQALVDHCGQKLTVCVAAEPTRAAAALGQPLLVELDMVGGNAAGCQTALLWRENDPPPSWGQALVIRSLHELSELCHHAGRREPLVAGAAQQAVAAGGGA